MRCRKRRATSIDCPPGFGPNITGGFIERIVADNTKRFADGAAAAGVPVNYVVRPAGSHTWGLFESEMHESWNTSIGPALGVWPSTAFGRCRLPVRLLSISLELLRIRCGLS